MKRLFIERTGEPAAGRELTSEALAEHLLGCSGMTNADAAVRRRVAEIIDAYGARAASEYIRQINNVSN